MRHESSRKSSRSWSEMASVGILLAGASAAPNTAAAATALWDPTGISGGSDGSASWNKNSTLWWNSNAKQRWVDGDVAVLGAGGAGSYTITLGNFKPNAGPSMGGLQFQSGTYTLAGKSIALGAGGVTAIGNGVIGSALTFKTAQAWSVAAGKSLTVNSSSVQAGNFSWSFDGAGATTINSTFSIPGGITKNGSGTLSLNKVITGNLVVNGGEVALGPTGELNGNATINAGGVLGGSDVNGSLNLRDGGSISPGNHLTIGSTMVQGWAGSTRSTVGGGTYRWEVGKLVGAEGQDALRGSGFDTISITGGLTLEATAAHPLILDLHSLAGTSEGVLPNWNATGKYCWTLLSASGGISGFDPAAFTIETSNFYASNPWAPGGRFAVQISSDQKSVQLVYSQVPEPSMLMFFGVLGAMGLARRTTRSA